MLQASDDISWAHDVVVYDAKVVISWTVQCILSEGHDADKDMNRLYTGRSAHSFKSKMRYTA